MKLMQELTKIREAATMDVTMDTICKACQTAKCKGVSYEQAQKNIAAEFRKLDKHDSSKMSDEALNDLIASFYNHDKHLSANDNVTTYRDVSFDYKPVTEENETEFNIEITADEDEGKLTKADLKRIVDHMKESGYKVTHSSITAGGDIQLSVTSTSISDTTDVEDDVYKVTPSGASVTCDLLKEDEEQQAEPSGKTPAEADPAPKRDLKSEAIGLATKWLKANYKKFALPLKVKRILTSGNYIFATKVLVGDKTKWVFLKSTADGNVKQTSAQEYALEEDVDLSEAFKEGDRIKLKANKKEGWGEEAGEYVGKSGSVHMVRVDKKYRDDKHDDGLREVEASQIVKEDAFGDSQGGPGSLDNQQQGGMPADATQVSQGPVGAEKKTPPPQNPAPGATPPDGKAPNRVIAKGGDFRVELGANEQVSIIDGKGNIRLSMPMVIWKELTRQ